MSSYFKILAILAVLTSCATAPLSESQIAEIDDIAFASFLEDEMPVTLLGSTVFNNEKYDVNLKGWNVNQTLKDAMIREIKKMGKTYKDVRFNDATTEAASRRGNTTRNRILNKQQDERNSYLMSSALGQGAKYLWIIQPSSHPYYPEHMGLGMFCRAPMGSAGDWQSYLLFHASLWDLKSNKKVFQHAINPETMSKMSGRPCAEIKKMKLQKFAESFRPQLLKLLQDTPALLGKASGLSPKN